MKRIMLFLFTAVIATTACSNGFKTSPTGVKYKVVTANPKGRQIIVGDVIMAVTQFHVNDSLLSENLEPMPLMVSQPEKDGDLYSACLLLHEGETMIFEFNPKEYIGDQLPPFIKETDKLFLTMTATKVQSQEEFEAVMMQEAMQRKAEEAAIIEQYMKDNNLNGVPTESGLYVVSVAPGKGNNPTPGALVSVHYTGKLLDGTVFDSSVKSGKPIEFPIGTGNVIQGWDEGIMGLKKGEKATLIIPSSLGYGERGSGPIPPNSILIFDVELVDIK